MSETWFDDQWLMAPQVFTFNQLLMQLKLISQGMRYRIYIIDLFYFKTCFLMLTCSSLMLDLAA